MKRGWEKKGQRKKGRDGKNVGGGKRKRNRERRWEVDDVSGAELNCIQ